MKKIGVLGTGMVGNTIGSKLIELGYEVKMGSRSLHNEKAEAWVKASGSNASQGTFDDVVQFGEILFNCTKGDVALDIFKQVGTHQFDKKIIIDIANPLDFSNGFPPILMPGLNNTTCLGEEIQKLLPQAYIVKTLNTVNCEVMVNAKKINGSPTVFLSGNNMNAKAEVTEILKQFNWEDILDLGDITTARGTEMLLPVWLSIYKATNNGYFGFKVVK
jgi:8-hydroxy-5-deazaflavin:NADPH oxidoreductase